ncbi:MAG TPA: DUF2321 domain-containing protein [Gemmataceae bacterium]|jgi:hypothetical protein|nr:DUF2321 domain-containing protein [Gemmataceae bacterium]
MLILRERMLVCRAGHLITERLTSRPDLRLPRCDRCGADTLDRCDTCGHLLGGAWPSHGLDPIGSQPPTVCTACGATFPWAKLEEPLAEDALGKLEHLLCRLPRVMRELRPRPDLDVLVRAVLQIHFDDVRPELRTPRYALGNCTAFHLPEIEAVVVPHHVGSGIEEDELSRRWEEDVHTYRDRCRTLVFFLFDPERRLPERIAPAWTRNHVRCVVAG